MTRRYSHGPPLLATQSGVEADVTETLPHGQLTVIQSGHEQVADDARIANAYPMYTFGDAYENTAMYYQVPTAMSAAFQFLSPLEQMELGEDANNLLSTWMSGEIAESGDVFDPECYYVQEDFFAAQQQQQQVQQVAPIEAFYQSNMPIQSYEQIPIGDAFLSNSARPNTTIEQANFDQPAPKPQPLPLRPAPPAPRTTQRLLKPKTGSYRRDVPPDIPHGAEVTSTRGRKRALSPERRLNARRVRSVRACGRCHALKGKCEPERPCKPCKGRNKRALDFPCMPELPEDRWTHLFTEELYGHLDLKSGGVFERMPKPFRDSSNQPFTLRLHQYFDDPELTIPVVRFIPKTRGDISKSVFPINPNDEGSHEVQPTDILSPPLVPAMNGKNFPAWTDQFRKSVRRWLDCAEIYDDIEWHLTFFREEHGKPWPRAVFAHICQYFHRVEWRACDALKSSLQSTVFAYMLGHSFYVPHEDIQGVLDRTLRPEQVQAIYDGEFIFVSPIHVDRFVKAMLYPFFRVTVARSLKGLQGLCAPNKHSKYARDQILATSLVLLIVAGSQQSKAVEKAVALERRQQDIDWTNVRGQICEIEEWIINLIIQLWEYKFPADVKYHPDEPQDRSPAFRAKIFGLYDKFQQSYLPFRSQLQNLSTQIPDEIDPRTFGANNIDRILKKFFECAFPPSPESSEAMSCEPTPTTSTDDTILNPFSYQYPIDQGQ